MNGKRVGGRLNLAAADWAAAEERLTVRLPGGEEVSAVVERGRGLDVEVYGTRSSSSPSRSSRILPVSA